MNIVGTHDCKTPIVLHRQQMSIPDFSSDRRAKIKEIKEFEKQSPFYFAFA